MAWGAVAGFAGNAGLDYFNTQAANNAARAAANRQMNFQKEMSDTAHQREAKDLRAAGLNPILSANAGASTPGGASYSPEKASMPLDSEMFDKAGAAALARKQAKATTENTLADTGLKAANTRSADKSLELQEEQKKLLMAQTAKEGQQARQAMQSANLLDKYGEAQSVMGLIQSGTGSIGNLFGFGGLKSLLKGNTQSKPGFPTIPQKH